ncbi:MAG: phage tail protein [Bacteroidales bacterium]
MLNAWPTRITGFDIKSDANEIAVEVIELAYEEIIVS